MGICNTICYIAFYYKGIIFLLKKLMKKTIITTSILALLASSLTFAATDITSGGTYTTYTDNADMGKIELNGSYKDSNPSIIPQETITNSDFSGSTFNAGDRPAILMYSNTKLTNTSFRGTTFKSGNNYIIFIDGRENKVRPIVENVDFSGATIEGGKRGLCFYMSDLNNVNFNGATISTAIDYPLFWISMSNASNFDFKNAVLTTASGAAFTVSGNADISPAYDTVVSNFDYRGATINGELVSTKHINYSEDGHHAEIRNCIMGDGTIVSIDANWDKSQTSGTNGFIDHLMTKKGLILKEGETFVISKYETPIATFSTEGNDISVKLTKDSIVTGGEIVIEDGASLEISEGVTLTLTDTVEFVVADGVSDISQVLSLGENSTIVMAGCTDDEAMSAFTNLFKTEDGSSLSFANSESFTVIGGVAVPEPSTYAAIFGAIALGFVAYRRRK